MERSNSFQGDLSLSAPDGSTRVRVIEQVRIIVGVVFDDGAVEAGGGHVVEGDRDAVRIDDLIAVEWFVGIAKPVAAAAASGGEGDAEDAAVELALEVLGRGLGDREIHAVAGPRPRPPSPTPPFNP